MLQSRHGSAVINLGGKEKVGRKEEKQAGWDFPGGPLVKTLHSKAGTQVQSLVGELTSHMLRSN